MKKEKEVEVQSPMVVTDIWDGTFMSLIYDPTLKMKKPDGAVEPSETVVGVLTPLERRL